MDIFLIRHAEGEHNLVEGLITGRAGGAKLTESGFEQSRRLGEFLKARGAVFDRVICSPAMRTKQTCETVCKELGFPLDAIEFDDDLLEADRGSFTGKKRSECFNDEWTRKYNQPDGIDLKMEGGESIREIMDRMERALNRIAGDKPERNEIVAIFGHQTAFGCLLSRLMHSSHLSVYKWQMQKTAISHLAWSPLGWKLRRHNYTPHIDDSPFE